MGKYKADGLSGLSAFPFWIHCRVHDLLILAALVAAYLIVVILIPVMWLRLRLRETRYH